MPRYNIANFFVRTLGSEASEASADPEEPPATPAQASINGDDPEDGARRGSVRDREDLEPPGTSNARRVRAAREKGFRAKWLQAYDFLQCDEEYTVENGIICASCDALWTCLICASFLLEAPKDRLGAGGPHGTRGLPHNSITRTDSLKTHREDPRHLSLVIRLESPSNNAPPPSLKFRGVTMFQQQCLINVYDTFWNCDPIAAVERKRRLMKAHDLETYAKVSNYMVLEFLVAISAWVRELLHEEEDQVDNICGVVQDGCTDRSDDDAEMLGFQYSNKFGFPRQVYKGRVAVNYALSRDGLSPDAQAIFESTDQYLKIESSTRYEKWLQRTPGFGLDGASVNLGEGTGIAGIVHGKPEGEHCHFEHAKAHIVELKCNAAHNAVGYFTSTMTSNLKDGFSYFTSSAKRQFHGKVIADTVGDNLLKIVTLHGVRWQASLGRSLRVVVRNWRTYCALFHEDGKKQAPQLQLPVLTRKLYLTTKPELFVGKQYGRRFEGTTGFFTATINSVLALGETGNDLEVPIFNASYQDGFQETLQKGQVLDLMEAGQQTVLMGASTYELYDRWSDARFVLSCAFNLDVKQKCTTRLSELTQRENLTCLSLNVKVAAVCAELELMRDTPGPNERELRASYVSSRESLKGITVADWESASTLLGADKNTYLDALIPALEDDVSASGPVNEARLELFDFSSIPTGKANATARAKHGNDSVRLLLKKFWPVFNEALKLEGGLQAYSDAMLGDWAQIKSRFNLSTTWQGKSNNELRTMLYTSFGAEYPCWRDMVNLDCGLPLDSSCAERWISLQNRIKSRNRCNLSDRILDDAIMVAANGPAIESVDWGRIMEIWNDMSTRGRYSAAWKSDVQPLMDQLNTAMEEWGSDMNGCVDLN